MAEQQSQMGSQYASYLQNGTLPPGAQAGLDEASASAKAAVRSKYAQMGMSGSTSELSELNQIDQRMKAQSFQYASQLLNSGVQMSGLSGNLYRYLLSAQQADDEQLSNAIANFAGAASGGGNNANGRGVNVRF